MELLEGSVMWIQTYFQQIAAQLRRAAQEANQRASDKRTEISRLEDSVKQQKTDIRSQERAIETTMALMHSDDQVRSAKLAKQVVDKKREEQEKDRELQEMKARLETQIKAFEQLVQQLNSEAASYENRTFDYE